MISFIIHSFNSPTALRETLLSLKGCGVPYEGILLLQKEDTLLYKYRELVSEFANCYILMQETNSLSAQVNSATYIAQFPLICAITDNFRLKVKSRRKFARDVNTFIDSVPDEIGMICLTDCGEHSFPLVFKRTVELLGYLYHPIFPIRSYCERWLFFMFSDIERLLVCSTAKWEQKEGSLFTEPPELKTESRLLFNHLSHVGIKTMAGLTTFLVNQR